MSIRVKVSQHLMVINERQLMAVLQEFVHYHNVVNPHTSRGTNGPRLGDRSSPPAKPSPSWFSHCPRLTQDGKVAGPRDVFVETRTLPQAILDRDPLTTRTQPRFELAARLG